MKRLEIFQSILPTEENKGLQPLILPDDTILTVGFEKFLALASAMVIFLTACCAPATTSKAILPATAFTATFVGFTADGQYLLAKPEQSKDNVQLVYDKALTLPVGQRVYVVGRLEGNLVYVTDLRLL